MLLSTKTKIKWNSKNKKHYVECGYIFTKMGDEFEISLLDATKGCSGLVEYTCDFCGKVLHLEYTLYCARRKTVAVDCCGSPDCDAKKVKLCILEKYGVENVRQLDDINERIAKTNLDRYGCENPFGNKQVQEKIYQTNQQRYGCKIALQNPDIMEKEKRTNLDRYGVEYYVELFKGKYIRENSPCWKGGGVITPRNRMDYFYRMWRTGVFERDNYTCMKCGNRSSPGNKVVLVGHHISNWTTDEAGRYDIDNGITLCEDCHHEFHHIFGVRNNNLEQIICFLKDEKVC